MELRQNLSDNLKVLRQAREATLEGFSLDIGISRSTLQEIEAGKANATLDTVDTIAAHLGVSPLDLLSAGTETPQQIRTILNTMEQFSRLTPEKQELAIKHCQALMAIIGGGEP